MKNKKSSTITINSADELFYSSYFYDDKEILDNDLSETIYSLSNSKPIKDKLIIKIKSPTKSSTDKAKFKNAFKNSFESKMQMKQYEIHRCLITGFFMFLAFCALLAITICVNTALGEVFYYVADLATWVFGWGFIEIVTIELIQLYIDKYKYKKIRDAEIIFEE